MEKNITADDIYDLMKRTAKIKWNGKFLNIAYYNEDVVVLEDEYQTDEIPYEDIAEGINNGREKIEFYELKKIEV